MEWQPIETAPKDGTRIIIYDPEFDDYKADILNEDNDACMSASPVVVAYFDAGKWVWGEDGLYWFDATGPTHWMPLPAPPKE